MNRREMLGASVGLLFGTGVLLAGANMWAEKMTVDFVHFIVTIGWGIGGAIIVGLFISGDR